MQVELVAEARRLEELSEDWDSLAVEHSRPYAAPGWLLPWWRHAAPAGAELAVLALHAGGDLVGVVPLFREAGALGARVYRQLGAGVSARVEPLVRPGLEEQVARASASALSSAGADLLSLEIVPRDSPWPTLLAAAWPGGARVEVEREHVAPVLDLEEPTFEEWLASKSASFRKDVRRNNRRREERGGRFRLADEASYAADLAELIRLHHAQWAPRGGSGALGDGVERMLADMEPGPLVELWVLEAKDGAVAFEFIVVAGGEQAFWVGGYDTEWASEQPSFQTMLRAIEHAYERGRTRVDLGVGGQQYKSRFASRDEQLVSVLVVPRRRTRTQLVLAPRRAKRIVRSRLSEDQLEALKRRLRR